MKVILLDHGEIHNFDPQTDADRELLRVAREQSWDENRLLKELVDAASETRPLG